MCTGCEISGVKKYIYPNILSSINPSIYFLFDFFFFYLITQSFIYRGYFLLIYMCNFMRNKIRDNFNTRIFLIWFNIQVTIIFLLNATTYVTMALYIKEEEASLILGCMGTSFWLTYPYPYRTRYSYPYRT